jgi:hypothetical protein
MSFVADFGYDEVPKVKNPPTGSTQVARIIKAEVKSTKEGKPLIKLFGCWPEWDEQSRWNATIWFPVDEGDADQLAKDRRRFGEAMGAFEMPDFKGWTLEQIATAMAGRYASAKVNETDFGLEAKFFRVLTGEKAATFKQPAISGKPAVGGGSATASSPAPRAGGFLGARGGTATSTAASGQAPAAAGAPRGRFGARA